MLPYVIVASYLLFFCGCPRCYKFQGETIIKRFLFVYSLSGFGQIVIAGIGMSCFVVLLVICVVVIYKTGYVSCGRGTTGRKFLKEASLSEQSEPLHDVVMRKMDTVV